MLYPCGRFPVGDDENSEISTLCMYEHADARRNMDKYLKHTQNFKHSNSSLYT